MQRGKWSISGVPHKDWVCEGVEDLGAPDSICQMCESQPVRFVHYMSHKDYNQILECGCDCAGHMEGNSARADSRDKSMRNNAARRRNFPNLKGWKVSAKGNPYLRKDGMSITIFKKKLRWLFVINHPKFRDGIFSQRQYISEIQAKQAAFDMMTWLSNN